MVAMLGGCALAPGGNFSGKVEAAGAAADPPPPGALQSITPELVRRQRAASADEFGTDVRRLFGEPKPYRIGSGDILNIVVWDHPDLVLAPAGSITTDAVSGSPVSNGYNVSADGQIQFPYVGPFKVADLPGTERRRSPPARPRAQPQCRPVPVAPGALKEAVRGLRGVPSGARSGALGLGHWRSAKPG